VKHLYFSIIFTVLGSLFLVGWGLDQFVAIGSENQDSQEVQHYKQLLEGFHQELSPLPEPALEHKRRALEHFYRVSIYLEPSASIALPSPLLEQLSRPGGLLLSSESDTYLLRQLAQHPGTLLKLEVPTPERTNLQQDMLLTLFLYAGVCAIVIVWLLPLTRRLYLLNEAAAKIGAGHFDQRVPSSKFSYIGMLENSFNRMADQIEKLIADNKILARSLSHDIRTPMACLRFGIEAAKETQDQDKKDKYITRMDDELTRMEEMTAAFLEYASLERHGFHLQLEPIDLNALAESVGNDCQQLAQQHNIRLSYRLTDMEQKSRLDFHWSYRAIQNLIGNAVQHATSEVRLTLVPANQHVKLLVEDDGKGIPADKLEQIFEPFVKLDVNRSREQGHFGLGLAITAKVMSWHKAKVTVIQSQSLGGACFILTFPLCK